MDLLNFPGMNPWLSMLPYGMMSPAMFSHLIAQTSAGGLAAGSLAAGGLATGNMTSTSNALSSPPLISSPKMETSSMLNRQPSVSSTNQQVCRLFIRWKQIFISIWIVRKIFFLVSRLGVRREPVLESVMINLKYSGNTLILTTHRVRSLFFKWHLRLVCPLKLSNTGSGILSSRYSQRSAVSYFYAPPGHCE